jgi:hypothetical protein
MEDQTLKSKPQAINQHHIRWNTCTITKDCRPKQICNHKVNPKGIHGIGNQINACSCVTRGRKHIGSTGSRNTCLALPLATAHSLVLQGLVGYRRLQRLNNNDRKEVMQIINKIVHQKNT